MSDTALVIMARYPEQGKVKTRLAHSLGDEATLNLYQAFLADLARRFANWSCDLHWAYTPANSEFATLATILALSYTSSGQCFPQQGHDLGERLHHVFRTTQVRHYPYTIVISSDSPHISRATIMQARQALETVDVVLGPAEDGGYYLVAMREPHDVFSGIPMSTEVVLQMTIAKAQSQGLSVHLLEPLFDVDELPELLRLAQLLQRNSSLAPATAAQLAYLTKASRASTRVEVFPKDLRAPTIYDESTSGGKVVW
jgi:rSAM/selenodomain-associated transferase 1